MDDIRIRDVILYNLCPLLEPNDYLSLLETCKTLDYVRKVYDKKKKQYEEREKFVFIFFCMFGCGHSKNFFETEWSKLTRDKTLRTNVDFVLYQFGTTRNKDGVPVIYPLDKPFKSYVKYAPYFLLHQANDINNPVSFDRIDGPKI